MAQHCSDVEVEQNSSAAVETSEAAGETSGPEHAAATRPIPTPSSSSQRQQQHQEAGEGRAGEAATRNVILLRKKPLRAIHVPVASAPGAKVGIGHVVETTSVSKGSGGKHHSGEERKGRGESGSGGVGVKTELPQS